MATLYQEARAALRDSAFRPRKRLGQNFLIQEGVIAAILRLIDPSKEDDIVEIGPGLGFLTRRLVETARQVWAIEVDSLLVERLQQSALASDSRFHLIHDDFLKVPLAEVLPSHKMKLVGNLPYSLSTPILFRLFEFRNLFSFLILMVQREVAERMFAAPGAKAYGTLSVWSQIYGRILEKISVSPEAFFPRPKVKSMILKIELHPEPRAAAKEIPFLHQVVRAAFGQRRKTLGNALAGLMKENRKGIVTLLRQESIDPQRRGETLSVDEFVRLSRAVRVVCEESRVKCRLRVG